MNLPQTMHPHAALLSAVALLALLQVDAAAGSCPLGKIRKGSKCTPCPPGSYKTDPSATECTPCPLDTFAALPGTAFKHLCLPCPDRKFAKRGSKSCTPCPPGKVHLCGKCKTCPPGTQVNRYRCQCQACDSSSVSVRPNTRFCSACQRGVPNEKHDRCVDVKCKDGYGLQYSSCEPCDYNTFRRGDMRLCTECPWRTVAKDFNGPNSECIRCKPGTYISDHLPQTFTYEQVPFCRPCPEGTTTRGFSKPICRRPGTECPPNTFEDRDGDCSLCNVNRRLNRAKRKCIRCPRNSISRPGVLSFCTKCPPNALAIKGQYRCRCRKGRTLVRGKCELCPLGTFAHPWHDGECRTCPEATVSTADRKKCRRCPRGTTPSAARDECIPVVKCSWPLVLGDIIPHPQPNLISKFIGVCVMPNTGCPQGLDAAIRRDTPQCATSGGKIVCPAGRVYDGKEECLYCLERYFLTKDSAGRNTCKKCKANSTSNGGLGTFCWRCADNGFSIDNFDRHCICPTGSFINSNGKCVSCPSKKFSTATNSTECATCPRNTFLSKSSDCGCSSGRALNSDGYCVDLPPGDTYPR